MESIIFYKNLLGNLTKNGKRSKATVILNKALNDSSVQLKFPVTQICLMLVQKLLAAVELKKVKLRKNSYVVPFPLQTTRRNFLISKEIISSISSTKKKVDASRKVTEHILSYLLERGSNYNKNKSYIKSIVQNRSNTHFRW